MADPPLTGLRAIEFGQLLAGPYVGTLLGDFGAGVIKVEAPGKGGSDGEVEGEGDNHPRPAVLAHRRTAAMPVQQQ